MQSIEEDTEQEQAKNLRKIKILGVDQDGKRITCFLKDSANYKKAQVVFYNTWGEELERLSCSLNSSLEFAFLKHRFGAFGIRKSHQTHLCWSFRLRSRTGSILA